MILGGEQEPEQLAEIKFCTWNKQLKELSTSSGNLVFEEAVFPEFEFKEEFVVQELVEEEVSKASYMRFFRGESIHDTFEEKEEINRIGNEEGEFMVIPNLSLHFQERDLPVSILVNKASFSYKFEDRVGAGSRFGGRGLACKEDKGEDKRRPIKGGLENFVAEAEFYQAALEAVVKGDRDNFQGILPSISVSSVEHFVYQILFSSKL
eukprot:Gb_25580 [translate_table: standard]